MKNFKVAMSLILAVALAFSVVTISSVAAVDPNAPSEDLLFAPWIDFNDATQNTELTTAVPGMHPTETGLDGIINNQYGSLQVKPGVGADKTPGMVIKELAGNGTGGAYPNGSDFTNYWGAIKFAPHYVDTAFTPSMVEYEVIGAASDFYFYIDLTDYKKYKVIKEEDEDGNEVVVGREDVQISTSFQSWLGIFDNGTAAGEGQTLYSPTAKAPMYLEAGDGTWIEKSLTETNVTVPKDYKGYVRIPRTSMEGIWGTKGDVLASDSAERVGDNLFNGPVQYIGFHRNMGGQEYEGAVAVMDSIGFLSYEFPEGIEAIPVPTTKVEVPEESSSESSEESSVPTPNPGDKIINVTQTTANKGDEVKVTIDIPANLDLAAANIKAVYDNNALELVSAKTTPISQPVGPQINPAFAPNKVAFVFATTAPINAGGPLFELTFKVKDAAAFGKTAITLEIDELVNNDLAEIPFFVYDGFINVIDPSASVEPSTSEDASTSTSEDASTDASTSTSEDASTSIGASTSTSNPGMGTAGVAGVASVLAIAALASAAAICFKKIDNI